VHRGADFIKSRSLLTKVDRYGLLHVPGKCLNLGHTFGIKSCRYLYENSS
jgi:hypothetical protein